ncbi:SufBD protein [Pyrolobus fumarii 1A]|uniref:SufBD protein n=1 Tax=Pyrolobus fumarii (strain DSM 11204 / 1A) TaxID=694429 RepID=G0EH76_PYRF1|nr:SufD family Fe-S cluster assembly protein [Pyrolobus fumarii]AEM39300.1 SufBD protein [Pyrolobus fumarii 1A]
MTRLSEILGFSKRDLEEYARRRGEPEWLVRRRLEAYDALERLPPDPLIDEYVKQLDLDAIFGFGGGPDIEVPKEYWDLAIKRLGIKPEELEALTGLAVTIDNRVVEAQLRALQEKGVILEPMDEAVKKYDWLKDYMLRIMRPDNRHAAYHIMLWAGGVFVYVPKGVKIESPLYGVFLISGEGFKQTEHTLIIVEDGASLTWVEGCTAPVRAKFSVHLGGLEAHVGRNARLSLYSVQNWAGPVHHRPVKRLRVLEGGKLEATPISFGGASIVVDETATLLGRGASAKIQGVGLLRGETWAETRLTIIHDAPDTRSELLSRVVVKDRARDRFIGRLVAKKTARGATGHMACNTLLLSSEAKSETLPALHSEIDDVSFGHEASVGRLSAEKLYYLRAMGFEEDEATSLLIQGFFEPVFAGLPFDLAVEVRKIVELALRGH